MKYYPMYLPMYIFFICRRQTPVGYIREYSNQNLTNWLNKGFRDKMLVILLRKNDKLCM